MNTSTDALKRAQQMLDNLFDRFDLVKMDVKNEPKEVRTNLPYRKYEPGDTVEVHLKFQRRKTNEADLQIPDTSSRP
jgi:hypothetical protein